MTTNPNPVGDYVTAEQAAALLDACQDAEFPGDVDYWAGPNEDGTWGLYGGDGDGVATVNGSLFCGTPEAIARLFEAAAALARTVIAFHNDGPTSTTGRAQ